MLWLFVVLMVFGSLVIDICLVKVGLFELMFEVLLVEIGVVGMYFMFGL